jgi:hypothetical protein
VIEVDKCVRCPQLLAQFFTGYDVTAALKNAEGPVHITTTSPILLTLRSAISVLLHSVVSVLILVPRFILST